MARIAVLAALLTLAPFFAYGGEAVSGGNADTCRGRIIAEIYGKNLSVVEVYAIRPPAASSKNPSEELSSGSGVLISYEGQWYILTNNHVVDGAAAESTWIAFSTGGFKEKVSVVGRDPILDLALLSVGRLPAEVARAGPARLADAKLGEPVYSLGYPLGARATTCGFIIGESSPFPFFRWTQAPLQRGSSGGPLFNAGKEVVGINTAITTESAFSFFIPAEYIKRILPRLIRENVVRHGFAGLSFEDASRVHPGIFRTYGWPYPPAKDGIVVFGILDGSPAQRSGIQSGDWILKLGAVAPQNAKDLMLQLFFNYKEGDEVVFITRRGTQIMERRVRLAEYPPNSQ